jgi:hypothetical protein
MPRRPGSAFRGLAPRRAVTHQAITAIFTVAATAR